MPLLVWTGSIPLNKTLISVPEYLALHAALGVQKWNKTQKLTWIHVNFIFCALLPFQTLSYADNWTTFLI